MPEPSSLLLVLDLVGTFAFGLNGALTAVRAVRVDLVGVLALGMTTALGGGIIRDVLIGSVPPATFSDLTYLGAAAAGALVAFFLSIPLERFTTIIVVFDAVGLSVFCVTGATKALDFGLGPVQAVLLGGITAVGGGTVRDVLIRRVPAVLVSDLYAVPALVGAAIVVAGTYAGFAPLLGVLAASAACFVIRMLGVVFELQVPSALGRRRADDDGDEPGGR
ncbi:trimeric intracellular cation channel family protein [Saccharopolyspora gloriosae]|uniref:trimeric intracellular cation channel family protein n=1 Tax=Saccharopolyspora gloriosae TaxID=455344 RepID=UPI001FB5AA40|nr:trimeric intracellular cation channel family protein [Saccharopolyspora gloriosae]